LEKLKILDLFSGIGGFSLGLENTGGFVTVAFCENEEKARKVLRKNWPETLIHNDVKELDGTQYKGIDIICGGYPCQGHSVSGKRKGLEDDRSGLWKEFIRIIREAKPKYVLIENSPNLRKTGLEEVLSDLSEEFHCIEGNNFRASDVGLPHKRERLYLLAHSNKEFGKRESIEQILQVEKLQEQLQRISQRWPRRCDLPTPRTYRGGNGVSLQMDRVRQLGNAVVPKIPELIGEQILIRRNNIIKKDE